MPIFSNCHSERSVGRIDFSSKKRPQYGSFFDLI